MTRVDRCRQCSVSLVTSKAQPGPGENRHDGRGLCRPCYERHRKRGTLDALPRVSRRACDVAEDADWIMRTHGPDLRIVADRLGMSLEAVRKALYRARMRAQTQQNAAPACGDRDGVEAA